MQSILIIQLQINDSYLHMFGRVTCVHPPLHKTSESTWLNVKIKPKDITWLDFIVFFKS